MFTLPDIETDTEAKKSLIQNDVKVFILQRQISIQIPIGFCVHLLVSMSLSVSVSVSMPGNIDAPQGSTVQVNVRQKPQHKINLIPRTQA